MDTTIEYKPVNKTCANIPQITQRLAMSEPCSSIAGDFGVSRQRISQIKKDKQSEIEELKAILHDKFAPTYIKRAITENELAYDIVKNGYEPNTEHETFLKRQDYKGIKILDGVGILDSSTIHFGDNNNLTQVVISPSYQAFLDFQNTQSANKVGAVIDIEVDSGGDSE